MILRNKTALISGGAKGLGAHIAMTLATAGADLVLLARDETALSAMQQKIIALGRKCLIITTDLAIPAQIQRAVDTIYAEGFDIDILVNNAGITKKISLLEMEIEDWDLIHDVNLRATFLLSKFIARHMIAKKSGKIINISSIGTYYGTPGLAAYSTSKAAINQLTKTMALEWGEHNLQINTICPAIVMTAMGKAIWENPDNQKLCEVIKQRIPLKRFAEPHEITELVLFLASSGSNYMNGAIIPIDDGAHFNPY